MEDDEQSDISAMDLQAFIIKYDLPSAVVNDLPVLIDQIPGIKLFIDFTAYVMIEFMNKSKAEAAKAAGVQYTHNGQALNANFATSSRVSYYIQDKFIPNIGIGF